MHRMQKHLVMREAIHGRLVMIPETAYSEYGKLGIYNIDEMDYGNKSLSPIGCYGRLHENLWEKIRPSGIGRWQV